MAKVSVIVPVYNVEKYLDRCVESIIKQTYENLEIILVNDGSTDSSGNMCDNYALNDKRIKVIHKKNGGLSSARNAGIDSASGDYYCFVDSDDWIANNMIETLLNLCDKYEAEISACTFQKMLDSSTQIESENSPEIKTYTSKEALANMFYSGSIGWSAAYKLYRSDLFKNIRYPVGRLMEDMGTTYKLYDICNKVVFINLPMYFYYIRSGSITTTLSSKRAKDAIHFTEEFIDFYNKNYPEILHYPQAHLAKIAPNFLVVLMATGEYSDGYVMKCAEAIRNHGFLAAKSPIVQFKYKPIVLLFKFFLDLTNNKIINNRLFQKVCTYISKYTK